MKFKALILSFMVGLCLALTPAAPSPPSNASDLD